MYYEAHSKRDSSHSYIWSRCPHLQKQNTTEKCCHSFEMLLTSLLDDGTLTLSLILYSRRPILEN